MLSSLIRAIKLHAPPTTLVVGILAWIYGQRVSGQTLQEIGSIITLLLAGAYTPPATKAVASGAKAGAAKLRGGKAADRAITPTAVENQHEDEPSVTDTPTTPIPSPDPAASRHE